MKKNLARITAGIALIFATSLSAAQVANATVDAPITAASNMIPMAGASCIVTGYSLHAEQRMAERNITSDLVENVVHNKCRTARKQSNGNYKYVGSGITVIANPSGYIVTLWRN